MAIPFISAQEAAEHIKNGDNVGFSGFTASGTPKVVTEALAEKAMKEHEQGREFKINLLQERQLMTMLMGRLLVLTLSICAHPIKVMLMFANV